MVRVESGMKTGKFRGREFKFSEYGPEAEFQFGGWEHEEKAREQCLRDDDIVFDVGACIGSWTIPAAIIGKHVYAFEPNLDYASILRENVDANGLSNKVSVTQNVVWNRDEDVDYDGWSTERIQGIKLKRRGIRLDTFCESMRVKPDFIKIDVEGGELKVLEGAEWTIREGAPRLMIEAHIKYSFTIIRDVINTITNLNREYEISQNSHDPEQYMYIYCEKKS